MTDWDRALIERLDRYAWLFVIILAAWAVWFIVRISGWGWAPPPEACRQIGQRPTPATLHLPTCPRPQRRATLEPIA